MEKYQDFRKIQEVRRPKKCPVLSFKPIRDSEIFQDMMSLGFVEALPEKPAGIETEGPSEQRHFKDRLGNIAFFHPIFESYQKKGYPQYNIMHNGSIRVVTGPSKSMEFPYLASNLRNACMTIEDYLMKMNFLVKYFLKRKNFPITDSELNSDESYKDLINRKMQTDPSVVGKLDDLPASLKRTDLGKGATTLKRFGIFGDDDN